MGKLLSLLARDNTSDCCGPKSSYDIFLDFENAQPSENELEIYQEISLVLIKSDKILEEIQVYKASHQRHWIGSKKMLNKQVGELMSRCPR